MVPSNAKAMPQEVHRILMKHREAIVIYVDQAADPSDIEVGVFAKMLNKNKGGKLASILTDILQNLRTTYSEKHSGATRQTTTDT